jgi:outer membrane protein assembly factor BamB
MLYRCNRIVVSSLLGAIFLFALPARSWAENWPGWRGPTGLGYSNEKDLPLTWDSKSGENIVWKALLHGGVKNNPEFSSPGWSSPIVWGDRIFLTTATWPAGHTQEERRKEIAEHHVLCFQASDGKPLWDTVVPAGKCLVDNWYHGYTVPTPVTDGKHVFALFGSAILVCLDFDGKIIWREELPRVKDIDGGICSSPILYKDTIILPGIATPGLRALDKKTGKVKWEQTTKARNGMATPALLTIAGKLQLIHNAGGIQGLDPDTGELLWYCQAQSGHSSPVFGKGLLYVDSGSGTNGTGTVVDPTGTGNVTKTHIKWQTKVAGAAGTSAIIVGDYLYRIGNPELIQCLKVATGELVYKERTPGITPSSSPIATPDGRIYFASSSKSYVIEAGPEFKILAVNNLNDSPGYTTPAISGGRMYMKGKSYLWCIGKK